MDSILITLTGVKEGVGVGGICVLVGVLVGVLVVLIVGDTEEVGVKVRVTVGVGPKVRVGVLVGVGVIVEVRVLEGFGNVLVGV